MKPIDKDTCTSVWPHNDGDVCLIGKYALGSRLISGLINTAYDKVIIYHCEVGEKDANWINF